MTMTPCSNCVHCGNEDMCRICDGEMYTPTPSKSEVRSKVGDGIQIQRYDFYDDSRHCTNYKDRVVSRTGDFVLFTDYIDKVERMEAKESAHAAEVERLTGERDTLSQKLKMTEEELDEVQGKLDDSEDFSSASLAIILRHVGEPELEDGDFVSITDLEQAVMRHNKASDAAVRERDALQLEYNKVYDALGLEQQRADSAERERDAAVEALKMVVKITEDQQQYTCCHVREVARAALAKIEGGRNA